MKKITCGLFGNSNANRGGMLMELLLSVALVGIAIPFLFQYQSRAVRRAENIVVAREMENIQSALERYIVANRESLLNTVGKNITRLEISDLSDFGLNDNLIRDGREYQLRILKSNDSAGKSSLQGVVVMSDADITPIRTREIVSLGAGKIGFVDNARTYGAYGTFRADNIDFGVNADTGLVATTTVNRDNALYLWRVPSDNASDATMQAGLNLGGHDIVDAAFINGTSAQMNETLTIGRAVTNDLIFQTRPTIDGKFNVKNAVVSGSLTADSRTMDVSGAFRLADIGKFSSFTVDDLWVSNLTLGGLSISDKTKPTVLHVNDSIDMTSGRITAMYVTVGFTGSITPRLIVSKRIEDSTNPAYFWDVKTGDAHFADMTLIELNRMASDVLRTTRGNTESYLLFSSVAANKNATVGDFMNALNEIQRRVRAKYSRLNLE